MRDRLIELLKASSKKAGDYIDHADVMPTAEEIHGVRADYLLVNGVIVPPCKVGDAVFFVHEICDENADEYLDISVGVVASFSMQKEGLWMYCRYEDGLTYWHLVADDFDKTVFLTIEKANKALKDGGLE